MSMSPGDEKQVESAILTKGVGGLFIPHKTSALAILSRQKVQSATTRASCARSKLAQARRKEGQKWKTHANDPSLVSHLGDVFAEV